MGVTLERVQNKFACIIGELCNEPIILSQFAIWVDLRIAEFKSKGAISLDCSGEDPDPSWMNGHRYSKRNERGRNSAHGSDQRSKYSSMGGGNHSDHSTGDTGFLNEARLSPELLLIKEEPGGDNTNVFPVGLHSHSTARKRPISETLSRSTDNFYDNSLNSPAKVKRLSSAGGATPPVPSENTSNQSLMSIISGGIEDQNQSTTNITSSDIEVILDFENKGPAPSTTTTTSDPQNSSLSSEPIPTSSYDPNQSFSRENSNISVGEAIVERETTEDNPKDNGTVYALRQTEIVSKIRADIKTRFTNIEGVSAANLRNMICAAATLECWLHVIKNEQRHIETMEVEELDKYLIEFFTELRRRDGAHYDPDAFGNFRLALDHYLTRMSYAESIRNSKLFVSSQEAFKQKRKLLVDVAYSRRRERFMYKSYIQEMYDRRVHENQ